MLRIGSLINSFLGLFSNTTEPEKKEELTTPVEKPKNNTSPATASSTGIIEARNLLNNRRNDFNSLHGFDNEPLLDDELFTQRMQDIISSKSNRELHDIVSTQEEDPLFRRLGAAELVNRKDPTAGLTFLFSLITDTDYELRKICTIGLGELGNKSFLQVLENITEDDPVYDEAKEAISKIRKHDTSIMKMPAGYLYNTGLN